jgi:hypothetical protein
MDIIATGFLTKAGGRRQKAGGCFCNGDLCPAPKTFRLKSGCDRYAVRRRIAKRKEWRGFRPDCHDK